MRLKVLGFIVVLVLSNQFVLAQESADDATPDKVDIDLLIKEISTNSQQDAFSNYSYQMEYIKRKKSLWGSGKLVKRFNVILPSRIPKDRIYQHRLIKTYDSRNRLTQEDILLSRNQIIEELDKVENEVDIKSPKKNSVKKKTKVNTGGYLTLLADANSSKKKFCLINLVELLKGAEFSNYKELSLNGRDTISLDFRPIPGKKFDDDLFYLEKMEGVIFIDKLDKRIAEVDGYPLGKLNEFRDLTTEEKRKVRVFHYLQTRVPEGFWFPKFVTLNFMAFPNDYKKLRVKMDFAFTNYQRFTVNVGDYTPNAVSDPHEADQTLKQKVKPLMDQRKDIEPKRPTARPNRRVDNKQ